MKKLLILSVLILSPHIASAQSIWMHNKSEMLLEMRSNGDFVISYLTPREGLSAQPGDFVVYGSIDAKTNKADGIARLFSAKCGTTGYEIFGQMSECPAPLKLNHYCGANGGILKRLALVVRTEV